jgi:tetratricopeptide (TPR) repeat protein
LDHEGAVAAFDAALAIDPDHEWALAGRTTTLRRLRRWDEAETAVHDAIARRPDLPQLHVELGYQQIDRYNYADALAAFNSALAIDPEHPDALEWRITALRRLRRWAEAETAVHDALTRRPDLPSLHVELGYQINDRYDYEGALAAFDAALDINPEHEWALAGRTTTLRRLRRWAEAETVARAAVTRLPDSLSQKHELADLLEDAGDAEAALDVMRAVLEVEPLDETALAGQIRLLRQLQRTHGAVTAGRQAVRVRPDSADILVELGDVHNADYHDDQALTLFDEALAFEPGHIDAIVKKIFTLRRMGLVGEAEQYAREASAIRSHSEEILVHLGHVYYDQLRTLEALASYDAALRLNPQSPLALASRSSALRTLRLYAEADGVIAPQLRARPHLRILAMEQAWIHHDAGRLVEAREAFGRLREEGRSAEEIAEALAGLGWVTFAEGDYVTAEQDFREAVRLVPHRHEYQLARAWALVRQDDAGQRREAERIALAVLDEHEDAAVLVCLGVINFRLGRFAAAEHYLTRSIRIDPHRGSHTDLGALYTQIGRYDEAAEQLNIALQQDQSNTFARIELGNLRLLTEQPQEAIKQFRSVPRTDPSAESATLGHAEALITLGRHRDAEGILRDHLRTTSPAWRVHLALARVLFYQADTAQDNDLFAEAYQQAIEAVKNAPPTESDPHYVAAVCQVRLGGTITGALGSPGAYRRALRHLRRCLATNENHVEAQRVIHMLENESRSVRTAAVGTAIVATVAISLLAIMWTAFFLSTKITDVMITTITPILLGLIAIAVLLPSLVRLKMPGFEADLQARTSQVTSGPTGDVVIRSGDLAISTGPAGYTLGRHGAGENRNIPR